jgi:hypothetical protein
MQQQLRRNENTVQELRFQGAPRFLSLQGRFKGGGKRKKFIVGSKKPKSASPAASSAHHSTFLDKISSSYRKTRKFHITETILLSSNLHGKHKVPHKAQLTPKSLLKVFIQESRVLQKQNLIPKNQNQREKTQVDQGLRSIQYIKKIYSSFCSFRSF